MLAAALNLQEDVQLLMHYNADISVTDLNGNSAMHYAYAFGCITIASLLENAGGSTSVENHRHETPLDVAGRSKEKDFKPTYPPG